MKNLKLIADNMSRIAKQSYPGMEYSDFAQLHSMAKLLRVGEPQEILGKVMPDKKHFKYFLKVSLDMRWGHDRSWDAGSCYEFDDGRVEIWCGGTNDIWRIYSYENMSLTHDWMLD